MCISFLKVCDQVKKEDMVNGAEALLSDLDKEAEGKVVEEAKQKTKVLTFCFFLSQSLSQPPRWSSRTLVLSCRLCPTASTSSGRRLEEDLPSPTDRFQQVAVICLAWNRREWHNIIRDRTDRKFEQKIAKTRQFEI